MRGLLSQARTRSVPLPLSWLEHAAPAPPLGPCRDDIAVNHGRRQLRQALGAAKPSLEKCSATTCHGAPRWGEPQQSERLLTPCSSWREEAGHDLLCQSPAVCARSSPTSPWVAASTARGCFLGACQQSSADLLTQEEPRGCSSCAATWPPLQKFPSCKKPNGWSDLNLSEINMSLPAASCLDT